MTTERRVLLVGYHFPPDPAVGALRAEKFVKYLPEHGWVADVLTVVCPPGDGVTSPGAHVERVVAWPSPRTVYLAVRGRVCRRGPRGGPEPSFEERDVAVQGAAARLKRILLSLLWCPDDVLGWWPPAVLAGRRLMRETRYAALLTIGPPHTAHLVGLALHGRGIRWVADFRDPWVGNPGKPRFVRSAISDALDRRGEAVVVARADAVVVGTERLRCEMARRYPEAARRIHVIPAGFDLDDFTGTSARPAARFTLAHFGTVYYRRSPEPLFAGIGRLVRERAVPREALDIVFAGQAFDGIDVASLAARHGIDDLLRLPGLLPRRQALGMMASAGALILLAQDQPLQVPAKAFEYLATGVPIVALTGDGATADLIRESKAGWVVAADDDDGIRAAVLNAYADWERRVAVSDEDTRPTLDSRFDRRVLTAKLAALFWGEEP